MRANRGFPATRTCNHEVACGADERPPNGPVCRYASHLIRQRDEPGDAGRLPGGGEYRARAGSSTLLRPSFFADLASFEDQDVVGHAGDDAEVVIVELSLVFVRTKHGADRLARKLAREHDVRTVVMHGNMSQNGRERSVAHFECRAR